MNHLIGNETLQALSQLNTCAVANAIETQDIRLRNEGFTDASLRSRFPQLPAMLGFAITLRIRSASPPPKGHSYLDRADWWKHIEPLLLPHVMVIEDMDPQPGRGAFIGEVHASILKALGCIGVVTNGAVRDLPEVEKMGFNLFSGNVSVSHAYAHIVEFGSPVQIAGLQIRPGDLLHGDQHGIVRIPLEIADKIPAIAAQLRQRERAIISYCRSSHFSAAELPSIIEAGPNRPQP